MHATKPRIIRTSETLSELAARKMAAAIQRAIAYCAAGLEAWARELAAEIAAAEPARRVSRHRGPKAGRPARRGRAWIVAGHVEPPARSRVPRLKAPACSTN
jgi:hypothetical protein